MLVSLALFGLFLSTQNLTQLVSSLSGVNLLLVAPAVAIYFVGIWLRALRWRWLMAPFANVSTARLFRVILIGFGVNNVLPLRLGEVVRTFLLRQSDGVPVTSSLATVLIERLLDVVALCALMTLVLLLVPLDGWVVVLASAAAAVTVCAVVGLLVVALTPRRWLERLFTFGIALAGRVHHRLGVFAAACVDGVRALTDGWSVAVIVPLSVACWVCELGLYVFVMWAVGFDSGILSLIAGMVVANLATALPSSPGYIGTFDYPLQQLLSGTFGVADERAGAYTILAHAALLLPVVAVGLFLLARENLSFSGLTKGRIEARSGPGRSGIEAERQDVASAPTPLSGQ
ncbi:MAG: flippase-like domain-containing protein [Chloroflexi bacterium]|nr:flippase-like domain-containing protein [Chloroflexota bacterium]